MEDKIDKQTYLGIVRFTLQSMLDLSKDHKEYNLQLDTIHYYESVIKSEKVITLKEFTNLCEEVGIK